MEEEKDEGDPLQDHPYSGKDHPSFPRADYSIEKGASQFSTVKRCEGKDYGDGMCTCRLDER